MTELNQHYDPTDVESRIEQHWSENGIYEQAKGQNEDASSFYFVDGPPFTSGRMHCGTAWGKVLKDVFLRYERMNGKNVIARPGYDTHGLPIEVKVEDKFGFSNKKDIEKFGVEKFIEECREYVYEQKSIMDEEFSDLGVWMDWDNPYMTMNKSYMETAWSAFYKLYMDDMIGQGDDVLNVCPRCETTLSDSELEYDDRTVDATYIGFDLANQDGTLVTWTTTPWTIVGHQFVAVDRDGTYARVTTENGETYYVASDCVDETMEATGVSDYTVAEELLGEELIGLEYNNPISEYTDSYPISEFTVQHADYVEANKTGLVHSAPGFGKEDYERGKELEFSPFSPVDMTGEYEQDAGSVFSGLYVHDEGTQEAIRAMDEEGMLLGSERYTHEYPHCPRCDTDVVFRATDQWMVKVTDMKDRLQNAIDETSWYPSKARDERFRNTVASAPDWNISRQRYWGTPIPVWSCEECGSETVVNSAEHLCNLSEDISQEPDDLHRSTVDDITVPCSECGSSSHRVNDVLDVWFDSSVASWGSLDAMPHENESLKEWPADLVIEGHDQTRGWFLMQLYQGVGLEDSAPYSDVLMHGFALLDGEPMSKSRGHVLRPPEVIEEYGRDALRSYMLSNEQQQNDVNMTSDMQEVANMQQQLDIVWNTYRFSLMYMEQDEYAITPELNTSSEDRETLDNWVLSRLDKTIQDAENAFKSRQPHEALNSVLSLLIEDVSRYYIKTIRDRVWVEEDTAEKQSAYDTLGTVLHTGVRLLAPFAPYLSDKLYQTLPLEDGLDSVHLESWPAEYDARDEQLEADIENLREIENSTSRLRDKIGRKQRWRVHSVTVETDDDAVKNSVHRHNEHLRDRVNANSVSVCSEYGGTTAVVDPDMSEFGPEFQQMAQEVADRVTGEKYDRLPIEVSVEDSEYVVTEDMVNRTEVLDDDVVKTDLDSSTTVYLDTTLTDDMVVRGVMRDLVRKLQDMRRELDLDLEDYVRVDISSESDTVSDALSEFDDYIQTEVRIESFEVNNPQVTKRDSLNDQPVQLSMEKK